MDLGPDPLALTKEQIRDLGYRAVDLLADQRTERSIPAMTRGDPAELRRRLDGPPPDQPRDWVKVLERLNAEPVTQILALRHAAHVDESRGWAGCENRGR